MQNMLNLSMTSNYGAVHLPAYIQPDTVIGVIAQANDPVDVFDGETKLAVLLPGEQAKFKFRKPAWWQFWRSAPYWAIMEWERA